MTDEKTVIAIKSNCKFAYEQLNAAHKAINTALDALEDMIVQNPTQTILHRTLLMQMAAFQRTKCVCTYKLADGEKKLTLYICDSDEWAVQITSKNAVRVHLTAAGKLAHESEIPEGATDVRWYL